MRTCHDPALAPRLLPDPRRHGRARGVEPRQRRPRGPDRHVGPSAAV